MKRLLFLAVLLCASVAAAQHQHSPAQPQAVALEGMGDVSHPVSTKNAEAQKFFDQGLALVYAFNHDEAARAFRHAAQLDPDLAMAWWGVALVHGPNYNDPGDVERNKIAWEAAQRALKLAGKATPAEQAYINAIAKRYMEDANAPIEPRARAYAAAMKEVVQQYPDDLDAATLYAESLMNLRPWGLWSHDGQPAPETPEILAVLEGVMKRDPNHTGANHYYIHAVEASKNPERALPAANRLAALAPAAGHLVHMPAHVYLRTGDYDLAATTNVKAAEADRQYMAKAKPPGGIYPMMYYSHNMHFEAMAHTMAGRYADAMKAAKQLEAHVGPHLDQMAMLEVFAITPIWVNARFHRWDEIMKMPEPKAEHTLLSGFWHYGRGMGFAAQGKLAEAEKELEAIKTAQAKAPTKAGLGEVNARGTVLMIPVEVLSAYMARAKKQDAQAIAHLEKAVALQDSLNYIEPPEWYYPVRESLGAFLLSAGRFSDAEKVFRADLNINPRNGRSLYGLAQALKGQKKMRDAAFVEKQFQAAWKQADTQLAEGAL